MARSVRYTPIRRRWALPLSALFLTLLALGSRASAFTFTTFDVPGGTGPVVYGINGRGQIVGYYYDANGVRRGFLATP